MLFVQQPGITYLTGCIVSPSRSGCGYFYVATLNPYQSMSSGIVFTPFNLTQASATFAAVLFQETTVDLFPQQVYADIASALEKFFVNNRLAVGARGDDQALAEEFEKLPSESGILGKRDVPEFLAAAQEPNAQDAIDHIARRVLENMRLPSGR